MNTVLFLWTGATVVMSVVCCHLFLINFLWRRLLDLIEPHTSSRLIFPAARFILLTSLVGLSGGMIGCVWLGTYLLICLHIFWVLCGVTAGALYILSTRHYTTKYASFYVTTGDIPSLIFCIFFGYIALAILCTATVLEEDGGEGRIWTLRS